MQKNNSDNHLIDFPGTQSIEQDTPDSKDEQTFLISSAHSTPENALLFGLDLGRYDAEQSMQELAALAEAGGMNPVVEVLQKRSAMVAATAMGEGKLAEAALLAQNLDATIAIYDGELSGSQIRNIEARLKIPVIDRTLLILEIFNARATTREGKTQTELATLEYRLPRLSGLGGSLSRQGGGGGGGGGARRGGGETKLEYDRRYIRSRISILKKRLSEMDARRDENRRSREKSGVPLIAMVGYTNVGKSSLVNALAGSDIAAADMLFATLDPTARHMSLPDGQNVVLIDTVGFVSRLPHHLVAAFKSTLDEAKYADILLKVCDAADPESSTQLRITDEVLSSLGATSPQIVVYNKCDKVPGFTPFSPSALAVSARTGEGLPALLAAISAQLASRIHRLHILLPYNMLHLAETLRTHGSVMQEEYRDDGVYYEATVESSKSHLFTNYIIPKAQK